jgi:hypothetical protein
MKLAHRCPHCGRQQSDISGITRKGAPRPKPGPGDLTLCIGCGEWSVFKNDVRRLRKPTAAERLEIAASPLCRMTRQAWELTIVGLRTAGRA